MGKILEKELLVLKVYRDALEAGIAQDILKENDIGSFLEEENILGLNPAGGVELKVQAKDFLKAQDLLESVLK
jgi:hypothetical protein